MLTLVVTVRVRRWCLSGGAVFGGQRLIYAVSRSSLATDRAGSIVSSATVGYTSCFRSRPTAGVLRVIEDRPRDQLRWC